MDFNPGLPPWAILNASLRDDPPSDGLGIEMGQFRKVETSGRVAPVPCEGPHSFMLGATLIYVGI